jgi:hypothetical protein
MKRQHQITARALLVGLALCVAVVSIYAATITLWSTRGNGRVAELQFNDNDGVGGGRFNLYQTSGQTYAFFESWVPDSLSLECHVVYDQYGNPIETCYYSRFFYDYGWGSVSSNDVQFTATSARAYFLTDGGWTVTHCSIFTSDGSTVTNKVCGPGSAFAFNLTWKANKLSTEDASRTTAYGIGPFTFTSQGAVRTDSAFVSGYFGGRPVYSAPGRLGDTIKSKNVATQTTP